MTVFDQGSGFTRWKNNLIHCKRSIHQRARHYVAVLHTPVLHVLCRLNHFTLKTKGEIDFVNYVHLTHEKWRILGAPPNNIAREGGARIWIQGHLIFNAWIMSPSGIPRFFCLKGVGEIYYFFQSSNFFFCNFTRYSNIWEKGWSVQFYWEG